MTSQQVPENYKPCVMVISVKSLLYVINVVIKKNAVSIKKNAVFCKRSLKYPA